MPLVELSKEATLIATAVLALCMGLSAASLLVAW
jgi:hypothetical protein